MDFGRNLSGIVAHTVLLSVLTAVFLPARRLSVELLPNMFELAERNTSLQDVSFSKQIAVLLRRGYIKIKRDQVSSKTQCRTRMAPHGAAWRGSDSFS